MTETSPPISSDAQPAEPIHPKPATPTSPEPAAKRSDLGARLFTAAVLIPSLLYVIYLGGLPYLCAVMILVLLGQSEIYGLIEEKGAHPQRAFGLIAGGALPVVMYFGNEYHATILMTVALLTVMMLQLGKRQTTEALASMSGTFFGIFYVGWLLAHAVVLRNFHDAVIFRLGAARAAEMHLVPDTGAFLMVHTISAVVLCDAGAYFAGRAYGKRKLAPRVSPGKTWEGTIGGILTGVFAGFCAKGLFDLVWPELSAALSWPAALGLAAIASVAGAVGDLVESLLKRDAKRKDAGSLLPGMGGILDRIDSALLAIPVSYYLLLVYVMLKAPA